MSLFANAVFGLPLAELLTPDSSHKYATLAEQEYESDDHHTGFNKKPGIKGLIKSLGFPPSARIYRAFNLADDSTDIQDTLDDSSLLIGWGVFCFPKVLRDDAFRRFVNTKQGRKCRWELWVQHS